MASGKKSRAAALALLEAVLERHQALDDAVASALEDGGRLARLEARDRAFARLLASTVLRHLGQLDEVIGRCLERPLGKRLSRLRNTLRLGATQILLLDTRYGAAVGRQEPLSWPGQRRAQAPRARGRRLAGGS